MKGATGRRGGAMRRSYARMAAAVAALVVVVLLLLLPAGHAWVATPTPMPHFRSPRASSGRWLGSSSSSSSSRAAALSMKLRAKEEGPGNSPTANLYVDRSCAGCGACRAMCPGVFGSLGLQTAVQRDPREEAEARRAYQAMVTCPYGAIRLRKPDPLVRRVVEEDFPMAVDEEALPGIYNLGYHDKESMGAAPYLIVRSGNRGNVMVDTPRFNGRLARQVEALGGVRYLVVTHEGSAPTHDLWRAYFPEAERVVHRMDATRDMRDQVEAVLNGKGPWTIDDDVKLVALPGYTGGSIGLLYRPGASGDDLASAANAPSRAPPEGVLFSGRTVGWSPRLNQLDGFAQFSRGALGKQAQSIRALAQEEFGWILPAEGTKYRFPSASRQARAAVLNEAADRFLERGRVGGLSM